MKKVDNKNKRLPTPSSAIDATTPVKMAMRAKTEKEARMDPLVRHGARLWKRQFLVMEKRLKRAKKWLKIQQISSDRYVFI